MRAHSIDLPIFWFVMYSMVKYVVVRFCKIYFGGVMRKDFLGAFCVIWEIYGGGDLGEPPKKLIEAAEKPHAPAHAQGGARSKPHRG